MNLIERRQQDMRAAALAAAARSTVNPGNVIKTAERYAYWIENGTDPGVYGQLIPRKPEPKSRHNDGCAFLESRGFCTCGADPDLMRGRYGR